MTPRTPLAVLLPGDELRHLLEIRAKIEAEIAIEERSIPLFWVTGDPAERRQVAEIRRRIGDLRARHAAVLRRLAEVAGS